MATHVEIADHLFMARQTVSELFSRGILPKSSGRGNADLDACREAYIDHLRRVASGRGNSDSDLDLSAERARKAKEEADRLEMMNAQLRGELLARGDVDAAVTAAFARVRAKLLTVPTKCAAEAVAASEPSEAEALIRESVCDALEELASTTVADLIAAQGEDDE